MIKIIIMMIRDSDHSEIFDISLLEYIYCCSYFSDRNFITLLTHLSEYVGCPKKKHSNCSEASFGENCHFVKWCPLLGLIVLEKFALIKKNWCPNFSI